MPAPYLQKEQQDALEAFVPKVRVRTAKGDGHVFTAPTIGATGQVCFGVRLDSGQGIIAKHDETEIL